MTKEGLKKPNYFGSITQASTCRVGNYRGEEMYVPMSSLLPMVNPNDLVIGGWDISSANMAEAMERAKVLDFELQRQLVPLMKDMVPLPGPLPITHASSSARTSSLYIQTLMVLHAKPTLPKAAARFHLQVTRCLAW